MKRSVAIGLASAVAVACSIMTSLDGLNEPTSADAGRDAPAAAPEGRIDAGGSDARVDAPEAATGPMCDSLSPAPYFCEDFDRGRALLGGTFTTITTSSGGVIALADAGSASAPGSLSVVLPAGSSTAMVAYGLRPLPATFSKAALEMNFRVEEVGASDEHDFISIFKDRSVGLEVRADGVVVVDEDLPASDGGPDENKTVSTLVLGAGWVHLRWEIKILPSGRASSVVFADGKEVVSFSSSSGPLLGGSLTVGERSIVPLTKPWRSRYDDIVLWVE